ncbi:MAG TPA: TadE family protein, partial [Chloroflexota bacterium]|nr:TadE family protein [Chloroflexota bacterium]
MLSTVARRRMTRTVGKEHGQSLVEFALVLPVLMLITLGIVDFGRYAYQYVALINAIREAAHYCAVHDTLSAGDRLHADRTEATRLRLVGELEGMPWLVGTLDISTTTCSN